MKEGHWPGLEYPRVTGHEVAGVIDEIGQDVTAWKRSQRVGSVGTAGTVADVTDVAAETSSRAERFGSRGFMGMGGMRNT